jgi:CRISPR-associated protein Cmr5
MAGPQSTRQTVEQRRAAQAWQDIQSVKSNQKEYGSLVRGFAAMIRQDGLGPALAFLAAKGKDHHRMLNGHLSRWVLGEMKASGHKDLLEWLLSQDSATYRLAASETLAYLNWLKRFAEAQGWGDE